MTFRAPLLLTAAMTLASPVSALAQTPPAPLNLKINQEVWITTVDGWDAKVVINQITATDVEVSGELGTRRIDLSSIRRIAKKDSNLNGFLIGTGVGVASMVSVKAHANEYCRDCKRFRSEDALGLAIYGGVGFLIDRAIDGRRTIYLNNDAVPHATAAAPMAPPAVNIDRSIGGAPRTSTTSVTLPVRPGRLVWVTTEMGWEVKGVISKLTDTAIEVSGTSGTKSIALADVRRIDVKDSNRSGFAMGAAFAVVPALIVAGFADEANDGDGAGAFLMTWAIGSALYGGVGALIDSAIVGRQTIWVNGGKITMQVAPIAARKGLGLGATIRW